MGQRAPEYEGGLHDTRFPQPQPGQVHSRGNPERLLEQHEQRPQTLEEYPAGEVMQLLQFQQQQRDAQELREQARAQDNEGRPIYRDDVSPQKPGTVKGRGKGLRDRDEAGKAPRKGARGSQQADSDKTQSSQETSPASSPRQHRTNPPAFVQDTRVPPPPPTYTFPLRLQQKSQYKSCICKTLCRKASLPWNMCAGPASPRVSKITDI